MVALKTVKDLFRKPVMSRHGGSSVIPGLGRRRWESHRGFKASLCYVVSGQPREQRKNLSQQIIKQTKK